MTCPKCGGETCVIDSRPSEDSVRRRRECLECGDRFNTMEIDADYYETLMQIDRKTIQKVMQEALLDSCEKLTKRLCKSLNIEERTT